MPSAEAGRRGAWRDAVRLSVGTLTTVPVRPPSTIEAIRAGRAMALAPVTACVPAGLAAATAAVGMSCGLATPVCAVAALAAAAWSTRGLHLDGLADTADGLAAAYDRERALDVMRRGDSGPAGVTTLALTLLLQAAALAQALTWMGPVAAGLAVALGRLALPLACRRGMPAARSGGLGAAVAGTVRLPVLAVVLALTTVTAAVIGGLLVDVDRARVLDPHLGGRPSAALAAAGAAAAVVLVTALFGRRCRRRLGGITGDVLGACVELGTTAAALALAVAG